MVALELPMIPRLVGMDLDGTLLNSQKELTAENLRALEQIGAQGIELVPTTGRFFLGMPEEIRALPFLHYAITINGAQVYDVRRDKVLSRVEISWERSVEVMTYLDTQDLIYDCYVENWGYITRRFQENAAAFVPDEHYLKMLRVLRSPVDELKAHLQSVQKSVQKIIIFTRTDELQEMLLQQLPERFPDLLVTSSAPHNLELNAPAANKGDALTALATALGIPVAQTMAIGDGLNDLSMLRAAGIAVAMGNAVPALKACADYVSDDCDHDGVAKALRRFTGI